MAGNFKKLVTGSWSLLLLIVFVITGARCGDNDEPEFVFMAFLIPITITPPGEKIQLGDTLWISGSFPDTLEEFHSGKYFRLENFDFKSKICVRKLVDNGKNISEQPGGFSYFSIFNRSGSLEDNTQFCGFVNFNYQNSRYNYKIGLLPNKGGIFTINFLWPIDLHGMPDEQIDLRPVIRLENTPDGRKRIPVYEAFYFVVNKGATNFDLFRAHCKAESLENPVPINVFYEQKGSFTFQVVE
jgi:hypothetical protein